MTTPLPTIEERCEVVSALLHNVELRLSACIPSMGMQGRADELERIGKEYIAKAERIRESIARDTEQLGELLDERESLLIEQALLSAAVRNKITDYRIIHNAIEQVKRKRRDQRNASVLRTNDGRTGEA